MKTLGDRWAWREPTAIMEDTQAINWEAEEEEETERHSESLGCILEPLGRLRIFSSAHGPEKDFPLYLGKNVVGRMPDCSVVLPFPSISKQHAVIEILAWNKAPVLQDCGSLNGTKILRPPKVLSPGVSHHLRDQELVVFADLPCQYHRLDVPLPFVSRGRLTVEETPREQGRTQPQGLLLAEDSEEEVDPLSERCVVKEPRTTSSPMATVVPESDEEGPSPPPDGPRPPLAFNLDSDTDKEEIQQPAAREASSAATAKTEQPKVVITEIHLKKDQRSVKEGNNDIKVKRDARNGVILERSQPAGEDSETDVDDESGPPGRTVEVHLERAQPSGSTDSDTDVEEEGVPATLAVLPVKKREIFYGVSTKSPGGAGLAHLQESPAGSYTDVEKGAAPLMVPQERNQPPIVIDSDTDDEEEVSAALALACLKESHAAVWNRDTDVKEARAQPLALLERSHTSAGTDSDTDVEEEEFPVEKRESVPKGDTDKAHSEKSQPLFRDCDIEMEKDKSSSGVHLEKSQASATVGMNTQVEEEVPPGPAVTLWEKHQVPVAWTNPTNVETEGDPAKLPGGQLEEARHPPGTPGEPTQPQRKGTQLPTESGREPHVDMTRDSGGNCDVLKAGKSKIKAPADSVSDSEDLDLQATQCFAETENQSLEAVPSIEDEPTQAFVPQEPGPSHCSFRDPGALDEPWEILPTQPFCPRESETSETQPVAAQLEAHGSCPSPLRAMPRDQHPESPVHTEPLRIQGRGRQTVKKGMGHLNYKMPPAEKASRVLFTGVVDARGERAVLALGGSLASSVAEASYLVTDRIRRTVKFLCALGRGIPILSLDWLHQSHRAGRFLPPDDYVVTDPEQEKNFGFSLRDALSRAQERRLLEGYEIHVTPGVQPPPAQMGEIISCCGGTVLPSMPHSYKPQRVVVTCSQDVPRCSIPFRVGVPILSPEFLLTGVLKQEATPEAFVLSTLEMSTT
ncbi:PREDICTED: mediator of DNA damage checkpoint protein 1 isoform X10 [Hipposideros armiger]|uniref:Mediator of DNA damage checkpoint protein 1 n=1 Tax=Hipposideros armiger TaxID=186990 RepID=A0A8B7QFQ7_HIPAR|nr:PREDICTED: mediator of DNA damage checkpoint protein 1 isoform X10 [Hipposideros armiger]